MLFDNLARVITRHSRVIVILWLVALLACVPLFSRVTTTSVQSVGTPSGDSATAQNIINSDFGNTTSPNMLFLVISSNNVTTPNVQRFVNSFASAAAADSSLSNLTKVATVYGSTSALLEGAVAADRTLRNGTTSVSSFFFGIPDAFVQVWNQTSSMNPAGIGTATNATSSLLASSIHNQTQLDASIQYLRAFTYALAGSYRVSPSMPTGARLNATVETVASEFVNSAYPSSESSERLFALQVLHSFNLTSYSSSRAVQAFVVEQVSASTLYTRTFAANAYPLAVGAPSANESAIIASMITNPVASGVPAAYQSAVTSFVSSDHKTMLVVLSFTEVSQTDVTSVRSLLESLMQGSDPTVSVTGSAALSYDFIQASIGDLTIILPITLVILIAATGIFFRSAITPGVSLMTIGLALGIADSAVIYLVGTYVVGIDSNITSILLTVIIGVGTDYSVFLLARYREERVRGNDKFLAVSKAVTWAGESIATSGLTVIISFIFLGLFSSVTLLKGIGFAVGGGVLVALLGSLTLIPSIIMLTPNFVFWPNVGKRFAAYAMGVEKSIESKSGYFSKSARFSIKHAKLITVLALLATVPAAFTWANAPVSYNFLAAAPQNLESVAAFNNLTQSFGAGTIYPTYAVMKFSSPVWNGSAYSIGDLRAIDSLSNVTIETSNVQGVTGPTRPGGQRVDSLESLSTLGSNSKSKLLEQIINIMISKNGMYALIRIDLTASPESETSLATAQQLRNAYRSLVQNESPLLQAVYLGGVAGSTLDSKNSVNAQFLQIITYVMVGVAAVLLVVLGSLFLPLFAIISIIMSIAWTLATTYVIFQHFYGFPLLFITPLALFVLLLGLGMDYNIFILTRIREEASKGIPLNDAITVAVERTGGIITAAALILAGSLGSLMISNSLLLKEFGFAFFFSVLIDAMIMRTYVVPSVMSLMGKWNFYAPGRLQKVRLTDGRAD